MSNSNSNTLYPVSSDPPLPLYSKPRKQPNWRGAVIQDKSSWFQVGGDTGFFRLKLNPLVTICSILAILAFILWCCLEPKHALGSFKTAKFWIAGTFSWLYVGSQDIWALVIIAIYFSKYGNLKLGKDDEEPEYNDVTWFAMLYACGVGIGLFFYGVAEPLWHYLGPNRYTADQYMPDNEVAQWAINLTFFHWGIHGWIVYVMVGIMLGFMCFRKGLPMTMKTCFYPLIGNRIYGWMGDLIDVFSVLTTLFGVCTSLGLGTKQINAGLNYLNEDIAISTTNQIIIIWCITTVATISVVSGVSLGIRRLSEVCFALGMLIMTMALFLEDTWYLLNVYCQSMGFYLQWIIQLGFHCDAFELSTPSYGAADRGRIYEPETSGDGPATWMDDWTIFYWGWWISWAPFVGSFIAKISRGRTIRQFINGAMTAPMLYTFLWMAIFGGSGIKTERLAAGEGLCCASFDAGILDGSYVATTAWNDKISAMAITQDELLFCGDSKAPGKCGDCEWDRVISPFLQETPAASSVDIANHVKATKRWHGKYKSDSNRKYARLSCMPKEEMWFATLTTYGDMGPFLCIVSLVSIVLYFVTSSDSGSLVIDIMSANGDQDPPTPQRIWWALVEGATATALLVSGGSQSLTALQAASIVAGLPYTIVLCFVSIALWRALAMEEGDLNPYGPDFAVALIDPFTTVNPKLWASCLKNLFTAPRTMYKINQNHKRESPAIGPIAATICFLLFIALIFMAAVYLGTQEVEMQGIYALAWVFYLSFVTILTAQRLKVREHHGINGNAVEDFFAALFLYPCVVAQMEWVTKRGGIAPLMPDAPPDQTEDASRVLVNEKVGELAEVEADHQV